MTVPSALRPCLTVCGSVIAFSLLIERAGFPVAAAITVLIASAGSHHLSIRQAMMLAVAVAAAMTTVFIGFLDQPFLLVPRF